MYHPSVGPPPFWQDSGEDDILGEALRRIEREKREQKIKESLEKSKKQAAQHWDDVEAEGDRQIDNMPGFGMRFGRFSALAMPPMPEISNEILTPSDTTRPWNVSVFQGLSQDRTRKARLTSLDAIKERTISDISPRTQAEYVSSASARRNLLRSKVPQDLNFSNSGQGVIDSHAAQNSLYTVLASYMRADDKLYDAETLMKQGLRQIVSAIVQDFGLPPFLYSSLRAPYPGLYRSDHLRTLYENVIQARAKRDDAEFRVLMSVDNSTHGSDLRL